LLLCQLLQLINQVLPSSAAVILPGTAAGVDAGADEPNADGDTNNSNENAADNSSKPSSPSLKSQLATSTAAEGQFQISRFRNPEFDTSLNYTALIAAGLSVYL